MIIVVVAAAFSLAHIQLDEPQVRYSNSPREVNKSCPCGAGAGDDHCNNGVIVDDNRDDARASTFAAGETITVKWRETIGHSGRYRIAFSPDGADLDLFNQNVLLDVTDPSGGGGNTGVGNQWEVEVTLPNTPCDNCVLQLVQDMGRDTANESGDLPNGHDLYFQCADLVLVAEGEGEGEEGEGEGGEGEGDDDDGGCNAGAAVLPGMLAMLLLRRRRNVR